MLTRIASTVRFLLAGGVALSPALAQQFVISTFAGGSLGTTGLAAVNAQIGSPQAVATDNSGNGYVTSLNSGLTM